MSRQLEPIARMVAQLSKLPSIGQKSAQRLAYHIIGMPLDDVRELASAIYQGRKAIRYCDICGNYATEALCDICADPDRHTDQICVVRDPRDVAAISDAPLVATHSNAHAVTPSTRNLTDRQLRQIADSGGIVGLNYATVFLDPNGRQRPFAGWDPVLRHVDHLLSILGEDHLGLGSDFDGATVPADIGDVAGNPRLLDALRGHGFGEELVEKIAWKNWLSVLSRTWGG